MTYMPAFNQSVMALSRKRQLQSEAELLTSRSREGLSRFMARSEIAAPKSEYLSRLDDELQIIKSKQYCSYFLIVADYVNWARDNGIAVGPGRGSGPCSLVGFALGITSLDPIKYRLPFERFVNPLREALPDFDLDFCDERCGEVTRYIRETYGADRVARICDEDQLPLDARLVVADRPLCELIPVDTHRGESVVVTAKMTRQEVDDAGLVRFNVINQKALTSINSLAHELEQLGDPVDIESISLNCDQVYRILSAGEQSGISLLDGECYRSTLMAVKPDKFSDLTAVVALRYPKLRQVLPLFVQRKLNPHAVNFLHPAIEEITAKTYGLILYQEQVMHVVHSIADFSYANADLFRRALQREELAAIEKYRKIFLSGALRFGLTQDLADKIFQQVATAGQCSFNKSHAVAFAMIAYQKAWLKCRLMKRSS